MVKRYQVFVSSTYEDLKEERKEIIENLLNAKYFPAGMEMFSASNEEQFKYIKKIIDDCDYYVLVLGGRYGSVNQLSGKSFTEMEYDYAVEKGIPILAFVHKDPENICASKREKENLNLFWDFRKKVLDSSKMCKMWSSQGELVSSVIISLVQIVDDFPRIGWSRGERDITELLDQINQLRIENEELKNQNSTLQETKNKYAIKKETLSRGDDYFEIHGMRYETRMVLDQEYYEYVPTRVDIEKFSGATTWNCLFKAVAPEIFSVCQESDFKNAINEFCQHHFEVSGFDISKESYILIKFQMIALNWIYVTDGNFSETNSIGLTEEGKREFMEVVTIKK